MGERPCGVEGSLESIWMSRVWAELRVVVGCKRDGELGGHSGEGDCGNYLVGAVVRVGMAIGH